MRSIVTRRIKLSPHLNPVKDSITLFYETKVIILISVNEKRLESSQKLL